ncbi:MAG: sulfatase [Gammaproteobacteria bacterium]|nr:sulfatase [Gammaproteobacteria bacterium]HBW83685.1 sulfatase [Gammaproteobacteria bacterium]|tara:strand:- start:9692 stop:11338 length:1647 start_codon:yes stop_codon:yes gene_type:complete
MKQLAASFFVALLICACDAPYRAARSQTALPEAPNILWLVAEDLSPIIPAFGDYTVATPNLDRLAEEGVRYTRVFSTSGVCAPSRSSLATGMYQNRIGAQHMRTTNVSGFGADGLIPYEAVPPPFVKMHSQYFREAGYYTSNNAKEDYQFRKAVTAWDDSSQTAHWRNRKLDQPFFSVFNFNITHESQIWVQAKNPLRVPNDLEVPIPPYLPDTEVAQRDVRQVYSNIVAMDEQVGLILDELERDGLLESTVIFWFSDHGGPLPRQKRLLYDSGLQVPMIIRYPDKWRAGERDDQLISFVDFKSTALSLAGIEPPDYVDGRAFAGEFQSSEPRQYIHAAADRFDRQYDTIRAVRDERFKYLRNYYPERGYYLPLVYREQMPIMQELLRLRDQNALTKVQSQWFRENKPREELFDTLTDPHELNNLAFDPSYNQKLLELRSELESWLSGFEDKGMMSELDFISEIWPGMEQPVTISPIARSQYGRVVLSSLTPGANIGYQILGPGESSFRTWQVYTEPLKLPAGMRLIAIAHRIGFKPSSMIELGYSAL